jgi:hypothetical protein
VVVYVGGNDIELGVDIMWGVGIFKTNLQIEMIVRHVDLMVGIIYGTETLDVTLSQFLLNEIGYKSDSWISFSIFIITLYG